MLELEDIRVIDRRCDGSRNLVIAVVVNAMTRSPWLDQDGIKSLVLFELSHVRVRVRVGGVFYSYLQVCPPHLGNTEYEWYE